MGRDRPASPARGSQGADQPPRSAGLGAHRWSPSSGGGGRPEWAPRLPTWPCLSCHPGLAGHPTPQWGLGSGSRDTARPTHLCNTHARAPACTHLFSQSHWHAHTLTLILAGAHTAEALGSSLPPHCWARCVVGGGGTVSRSYRCPLHAQSVWVPLVHPRLPFLPSMSSLLTG